MSHRSPIAGAKPRRPKSTAVRLQPLALVLACLPLAWSASARADINGTVFFGDSLTDSGFYKPLLPAGTGKFTTNPGPVWAENLATALGGNASPSNAGGTDYAQGGARVAGTPGVGAAPASGAQPVQTQITNYLASTGGRASGSTLYSVWAGANDVFVAINPSVTPPASAASYLATTAQQAAAEVARLTAAGARYVLVPTVPDVGATPFGASQGAAAAAQITAAVAGYNQLLYASLAGNGVSFIPVDTFTLLREVSANPAAYGFSNATGVACNPALVSSSLICTSAALVTPTAAQTYVFADGVHPTTAAHKVISDYVLGILRAPGQISLLAELPLKARAALASNIQNQLAVSAWARPQGGANAWASVSGNSVRFNLPNQAGVDGKGIEIAAGVDTRLSPGMTLGAAVGLSRQRPDLAGGGSLDMDETTFALYAGYRQGAFGLSVVGAASQLDFDTRRDIALGTVTRSASGGTTGSNVSLSVLGHYELGAGTLRHGPVAGLALQQVRVQGYAENSGGSSAMWYDRQSRASAVGSLGYQVAADLGRFQPFGRLSLEHEFKSSGRSLTAGLNSISTSGFAFDAAQPDRNWGSLTVGVGAKLTNTVAGSLALVSQFGQSGVRHYSLQAGVSMGF